MIPPSDTPERLRYTYWYHHHPPMRDRVAYRVRMHYAESNIMMLNVMALVFGRLPEQAPFFIKPLLRAVSNKAEQGTPSVPPVNTNNSFLWPAVEVESGVH